MKNYKIFLNENYLISDAVGHHVGEYVYHVTPENRIHNIKNDGFQPQNGISINGEKFENRLYFATSLISAYDLTVNFGSYKDNDNYVIFKIKSECLNDYELDPLFGHGIYIDYSVPYKYVVDVIEADSLFNKYNEDDIDNLY